MHATRFDSELQQLAQRSQTVLDLAAHERRDLTADEIAELRSAQERMEHLRDSIDLTEQSAETARRVGIIDAGMATRSAHTPGPYRPGLIVGDDHLAQHLGAIQRGETYGVDEDPRAVETRSRVTAAADMGSAGAWADGAPNAPRNLIAFAGVPVSPLAGRTAQMPRFDPPTGEPGSDEPENHPEYADVDRVDLVAARYGRWTDVSSIVNDFDGLGGVNTMHGWGIARDLDRVAITALEAAAGTPGYTGGDLDGAVREMLLEVSAATYSDQSSLVLVGRPMELAALTGTAPTSGSDVESYAVRFHGARLYPSLEAGTGVIVAFSPTAHRVFQSPLRSATAIDPASGAQKFGQWLHSTPLGQQIAGAAMAVMTAGS